MHYHEGVYVEDEDAVSTETPLDPDSLGTLIRRAGWCATGRPCIRVGIELGEHEGWAPA
jgi:hypothetical protein